MSLKVFPPRRYFENWACLPNQKMAPNENWKFFTENCEIIPAYIKIQPQTSRYQLRKGIKKSNVSTTQIIQSAIVLFCVLLFAYEYIILTIIFSLSKYKIVCAISLRLFAKRVQSRKKTIDLYLPFPFFDWAFR